MKLVPGLYEKIVTRGLDDAVRAANDTQAVSREKLSAESAPHVLGRHLFEALVRPCATCLKRTASHIRWS